MKKRHLFELIGILFVIGLILFGLHLDRSYRSLVASTANAPALLEADVLENYGQQLEADLTARNVELAIVSRAGQTRSRLPDGVSYTHSAFFVRNGNNAYDVYNLYHGDENRLESSLVQDNPTIFLRPTRAHDLGVIIPTPEFQSGMKNFILSPAYARLHNPKYSLISNPFDLKYQNCNEFMLDAMAAFFFNSTDKNQLKSKIETSIEPTEIEAGPIKRKLAPFVDERLIMDDHGDKIQTTTRLDLKEFIDAQGQLAEAYVLEFSAAD